MATVAAVIFQRIHQFATYTDFSKIVNIPVLIAVNLGVCMIAAVLFFLLQKLPGLKGRFIFNLFFVLMSFMSVTWSFAVTLPLDLSFPELFPGLTVPMHFFPGLAWFTFQPLFISDPKPMVSKKHSKQAELKEMEL